MFAPITKFFFAKKQIASIALTNLSPPEQITLDGNRSFELLQNLTHVEGFPHLNWEKVSDCVERLETEEKRSHTWGLIEHGWLKHMRDALGHGYRISESEQAIVLSSLTNSSAKVTLNYLERTNKRILQVLDGVAELPSWGKDILIIFDDDDAYYRYASYHYPDSGEFAFSSGMYINGGCGHYITQKHDLHVIEPIIAHEATHGCLGHLPIPVWLNEGLAVNMEIRLTGKKSSDWTPDQLRSKHLNFWGTQEIQDFWSGASFTRTDDGNVLSYDLARILVEQFSADSDSFKAFILSANKNDAGNLAARQHLNIDLASSVCAFMDEPLLPAWVPDPKVWSI